MLWFILALTAALSTAANDVIAKRFFSDLSPYEMGMIRLLYAFPCLCIAFFLVPRPEIDAVFFTCLALGLPLELLALVTYMKAIKISPLSLTVPFLAFTPAFVILTGNLLLGEFLTSEGMAGILLIVIGSYLLNLSTAKDSWWTPFKAIFREQGSRLMLLTSFIYSFTATLGKLAITHSSPPFFAVTYFLFFSLLVFCLYPFVPGKNASTLARRPIPGILAGLALTVMVFSHTLAISIIQAAYMLAVKRSSLIFGVILGAVVFREKKIRERLLGASVMMAGVILIALRG